MNAKVEIYLVKERSDLAFFGTHLGHIFGSKVGNEFGVIMRRKGPHELEFAYNMVRIHSLMIYTDLIVYNIVDETKTPLLHLLAAISIITNSAFTRSYSENLFWNQQFDHREVRNLRCGQPIVVFVAADNSRPYVTIMEAMKSQGHIPSIPYDNFKDHYVLLFDLTSIQDATENSHYTGLVGEPLRLELNFTFPLENVTESLYWQKLQLTSLVLL